MPIEQVKSLIYRDVRRTACHLCSALGTSLSLRLRKAHQSSHSPSHLPFASISYPPPASNRQPSIHRMAFTQHESRGESIGSFPSIPRTPPRSSGFRTKWHTLSSSARGLLCFHPPDDAYENHWPSDNKVALHTPSRSKSAMSQPSSRDITAPWNVVRSRSCQVHTEKVAKYEARETIWDDKMTTTTMTTTKLSSPGSKPSSEAAASVNAPLIEQSSARRPGLANPLYDDHMASPLHFNMTQTRAEGGEDRIATGDTIEALIDTILQIGDSEEWDSVASFGTSSLGTEAAIDDKSMVCGVGEEKTKNGSAGATEDADADERRAWEDMKRRVMHIEEFGALPLDGASAGDSERTSREFRARRRKSWAEKAIRGPAREETSRRSLATKKRRRHAGCWVREDGVFMRLVRDISSMNFTRIYLLSQYARRM
jgi:hypothetical protein